MWAMAVSTYSLAFSLFSGNAEALSEGMMESAEGAVTLLARLIAPVMTDAATANLSLVGSILIFCVGLNLVWGKRVRVANLLPAVVLAVVVEYLPLGW